MFTMCLSSASRMVVPLLLLTSMMSAASYTQQESFDVQVHVIFKWLILIRGVIRTPYLLRLRIKMSSTTAHHVVEYQLHVLAKIATYPVQ